MTEFHTAYQEAFITRCNPVIDQLKKRLEASLKVETDPDVRAQLIRLTLSAMAHTDPDSIDGFHGITIVERADDMPYEKDCFAFIFDASISIRDAARISQEVLSYTPSFDPVPGAYAAYFDDEMYQTHVGRVTSRGTVISKWGLHAHAYEHPPMLVPISYGNTVLYFCPPGTLPQ